MNLHQIVRGAIASVNPDQLGLVRISNGYTTASDGTRKPKYDDFPNQTIQEQPLSGREVEHLDSLNIQGVMRGFFLNGNIQGAVRPIQAGGDLIIVPSGTYLVVHVFATWATGWCHVGGALQMDGAASLIDKPRISG
jgi:hypothetical protein